jgi:predicted Zn-dependent protease
MKKYIIVSLVIVSATINAFSQDTKFSKERMDRIMATYKKGLSAFASYDRCGSAFDRPADVVKRAENRQLDKLGNITPEQEAELGLQMFQNSQEPNLANDPRSLAMVRGLVTKMAAYSSDPSRTYHVYILNSDQVNAYSTIGDYIYITTELLKFVKSKDELAFVVGHEMGHILNHHCLRKMKKIALIASMGEKLNYQRLSNVAINATMAISAPFDQMDEYDADATGFDLVKKSGMDPSAFNSFFGELEKLEHKKVLARFTSTHPSSANRRKCLNVLLNQ